MKSWICRLGFGVLAALVLTGCTDDGPLGGQVKGHVRMLARSRNGVGGLVPMPRGTAVVAYRLPGREEVGRTVVNDDEGHYELRGLPLDDNLLLEAVSQGHTVAGVVTLTRRDPRQTKDLNETTLIAARAVEALIGSGERPSEEQVADLEQKADEVLQQALRDNPALDVTADPNALNNLSQQVIQAAAVFQFDQARYEGLDTQATLTLTHAASNQNGLDPDQVSVTVHSAQTDPTGETVVLTETGNNTGVFQGRVGFERPYTSTTATPVTAGNGKVGVYAEGGRKTELLTATFATLTTTAEYTEPSSTVTGVVTDAGSGSVVAGALVELSGDGVPLRAISRPDGVYSFYDVPSGLYTLVVARDGYVLQTTTVTVP